MLYADLDSSVNGSTVVRLSSFPERRIVVVHSYTWSRNEEERCAAIVGARQGFGLIEVGLAEGDGLAAQGGEAVRVGVTRRL